MPPAWHEQGCSCRDYSGGVKAVVCVAAKLADHSFGQRTSENDHLGSRARVGAPCFSSLLRELLRSAKRLVRVESREALCRAPWMELCERAFFLSVHPRC
jgi:hypothetical protein